MSPLGLPKACDAHDAMLRLCVDPFLPTGCVSQKYLPNYRSAPLAEPLDAPPEDEVARRAWLRDVVIPRHYRTALNWPASRRNNTIALLSNFMTPFTPSSRVGCRWSPRVDGVGLFAKVDLARGTVLNEVTVHLARISKATEQRLDESGLAFSVVNDALQPHGSYKQLMVGPQSLINASCAANVAWQLSTADDDGTPLLKVATVSDIQAGSELLISYGDSYFLTGTLRCVCDACVGTAAT